MVGSLKFPGYKYNTGIGYIAIPADLDRVAYLVDCYKNCCVSIRTEEGGFLNRVPISPEILGFVEFPLKVEELGTPVVYSVDENNQNEYIVSRFMKRDELGDMREHMFKFKRKVDGAFVEISGSAESRSINLLIDGADKKGSINLNVFNKNHDCEVNVDVAGTVNVSAAKGITIINHDTLEVKTIEDADTEASLKQTSTENKFYCKKLILNDGEEQMVLGNKLQSFMNDFIDQVAAITVATAIGTQPILNKIQVTQLKQRTDEFLSKEGYLDK